MDQASVSRYISENLGGVEVVVANGDSFFFHNPDRDIPKDHRFPFATLVTSDRYHQFSNLDRPGVFRLNIGVSKQTFASLFGELESRSDNFTAIDRLLPHPVYGKMHWLCVLNPSEATFEKLKPLLAEAHALAARRHPASRSPNAPNG